MKNLIFILALAFSHQLLGYSVTADPQMQDMNLQEEQPQGLQEDWNLHQEEDLGPQLYEDQNLQEEQTDDSQFYEDQNFRQEERLNGIY